MELKEGKTKIIKPLWKGLDIGDVTNKDDITGGNGEKHDVLSGKAELATRTTCNIFEHLMINTDTPLAYIGRDSPTTFLTKMCKMILVEVVVRKIATGSYLKRNPGVEDGFVFEEPVVEFYYKTSGRKLGDIDIPDDDPLMCFGEDGAWHFFDPKNNVLISDAAGYLSQEDGELLKIQLDQCAKQALAVFNSLHYAWHKLGGVLYDFKLEFGTLSNGEIAVADVIDCDSWRVMWNGIKLSKQGYRDGDDLEKVLGVYRLAASLTDRLSR